MSFQKHFPSVAWVFRTFTGRLARRIYFAAFLLLLCAPIVPRFRNMLRARKFQAVLAGLEQVKVDQTTEAELLRLVPYLTPGYSGKDREGSVETWYNVEFSNEFDWSSRWPYLFGLGNAKDYRRMRKVARLLGASFLSFKAGIKVRKGKVSEVSYGVNNWGGWPRVLGDLVSAKSVHGPWLPFRRGFRVSSVEDENPQFRVSSGRSFDAVDPDEDSMRVKWTFDAPPELVSHVYRLDLNCVWNLRGCLSARDMAPLLRQDEQRILAATEARLISREPCPDRILAGRVRYLPDVDVLLLEVVDFQQDEVNTEGELSYEFNTDYKLIEVIRGPEHYPSRLRLRYRPTALSPSEGEEMGTLALGNPVSPLHHTGDRVLFFTNLIFESCQVVPATPSALTAVRTTVGAPKLPEDELPTAVR
jgi:hypothetical protein